MALTDPLGSVLGDGGKTKGIWAWTLLRLLLGWSFVWAFLDKILGLGFFRVAPDASCMDFVCNASMIRGAPLLMVSSSSSPNPIELGPDEAIQPNTSHSRSSCSSPSTCGPTPTP